MKKSKISFLFLYVLIVYAFSSISSNLIAQSIEDSTFIYYKSIKEKKDISNLPEALDFFESRAEKALQNKDFVSAAYYLELISLGQFEIGFYYESEATTIKALNILSRIDGLNTIEPKKRLNNQLGMLYRKIKDYDNASFFYKKALKLNTEFNDKLAIVINIANLDADQGNYKKAIDALVPYYSKAIDLENLSLKASYFDNLGFYQSKCGGSNAQRNMERALEIRKIVGDSIGLFSSYRHLSLYYANKKNKEIAKKYARKTQFVSEKINSTRYKAEAAKLVLLHDDNVDFQKFIKLIDTMEARRLLKENKFAAIKYNINESEKKLKKSQLQVEKQKRIIITYFFGGIFLLSIMVFLYVYLKSKHKKEKLQQVLKTEIRISKKVHDEVANDLYYAMAKLQSPDNNREQIIDDLEIIYNKTRDISRENNSVDVNKNYDELISDLLLSYKTEFVNVFTRNISKINWNMISSLKKITLYRVLQELMTNMRKHSNASSVVLAFNQNKNSIEVKYKDNGIGCFLQKQNGLLNVENRINSINGNIIFESEAGKGFRVEIRI